MKIESNRKQHAATKQPRIAAVVLAAGTSTRMGKNKLLTDMFGEVLVRRVVRAAEKSRARPIVVVTGQDHEFIRTALAETDTTLVYNPDFLEGMSTSLRVGIHAVSESDGAVILLGDMPGITANLIDRMIASFDPDQGRSICVATYKGRRGHPVLFDHRFHAALQSISGDVGARQVLAANEEAICEVDGDDEAPLIDIDTPDDLARFFARQ